MQAPNSMHHTKAYNSQVRLLKIHDLFFLVLMTEMYYIKEQFIINSSNKRNNSEININHFSRIAFYVLTQKEWQKQCYCKVHKGRGKRSSPVKCAYFQHDSLWSSGWWQNNNKLDKSKTTDSCTSQWRCANSVTLSSQDLFLKRLFFFLIMPEADHRLNSSLIIIIIIILIYLEMIKQWDEYWLLKHLSIIFKLWSPTQYVHCTKFIYKKLE